MPRPSFSAAAVAVAERDTVMAELIERTGRFRLPKPGPDHFSALSESILYQQLAGPAAAAIHRRFLALPELLPSKRLQEEGERFRPYRTAVAWYCWQAVHAALPAPGRRAT